MRSGGDEPPQPFGSPRILAGASSDPRTHEGRTGQKKRGLPAVKGRAIRPPWVCGVRVGHLCFPGLPAGLPAGVPTGPRHALGIFQADPRQVLGRFSPWGKFFACTLARGIPSAGRNFLGRGEGCEESHSQVPDAPVRPSIQRPQRRLLRKFCCFSASISCKVFRLWHEWHRLW